MLYECNSKQFELFWEVLRARVRAGSGRVLSDRPGAGAPTCSAASALSDLGEGCDGGGSAQARKLTALRVDVHSSHDG